MKSLLLIAVLAALLCSAASYAEDATPTCITTGVAPPNCQRTNAADKSPACALLSDAEIKNILGAAVPPRALQHRGVA